MRLIRTSFALLFFLGISCSQKSEELKPVVGNITESVYASGVIKAEDQYTVYSTVIGILRKVNVLPHQSIPEGQLLFVLDSDKAQLNTANAQLVYELSQENSRFIRDKITEMEMKVKLTKDKLSFDQSIYNKNKKLKDSGYISEVDYDNLELAYKNSKFNYESAIKQLAELNAQLKNEESRNNINLKISQKAVSDFNIRSAFSGELYDVLVKEGTLVTTLTPLAVIGKTNSFLLELEVDENDMVRVVIGQKALVTMDSYKGQVFEATVDKIYPIMDERSRTFKIEAHFAKPPKKLYPHLTAEANIIIRTKKNAITIPKSYLILDEYVLVNKDEKRKVKIGLSDYQKVEILEGLKAEETIYKPEE
jgi:HlyD family secretion protein